MTDDDAIGEGEIDDDAIGDRVAEWCADTTRRVASSVVRLGEHAWGLVTPEWPISYQHNGILVREDPGADQVVRWGDDVLGAAGLDHRYVIGLCPLTGATRTALESRGYDLQDELLMARDLPGDPFPPPGDVDVEIVEEAAIAPLQRRLWVQEWLPGADAETVRQLTGRRATYSRIGKVTTYTVRDQGTREPVSALDLRVRGWCAEVDGVATLEPHRGRGYGDGVLARAVADATSAGCTHAVLTALADDWPLHWYARHGFRAVHPSWVATWLPTPHEHPQVMP